MNAAKLSAQKLSFRKRSLLGGLSDKCLPQPLPKLEKAATSKVADAQVLGTINEHEADTGFGEGSANSRQRVI